MRLKYRIEFFFKCHLDSLRAGINRLGSILIPHWHFINHNCIITTGQIVKDNYIYAYEECMYVDIVRLLDVYKDKDYVYRTLYFFKENKIITVCQSL